MSFGERLLEARLARGVSLEQAAAATRIRLSALRALEEGPSAELPAPVYARGYLRSYASYLEIDPTPLLEAYEAGVGHSSRSLALRPLSSFSASPNLVLTAPLAGAVGLLLLLTGFTAYVYRALDSVRTPPDQPRAAATAIPSPAAATPPGVASPQPATSPPPVPATVAISTTDNAWVNVLVDGHPQFGDAGKILDAGVTLTFTGVRVKITTGKGLATFVNVDGHDLGAMGSGVVTREYTAAG